MSPSLVPIESSSLTYLLSRAPILHRLLRQFQNRYIWYMASGLPLLRLTPPPGPAKRISVKFSVDVQSTDGQGTKWRRNIAENFNRLSRALERYTFTAQTTDRRQTDGRGRRHQQRANQN